MLMSSNLNAAASKNALPYILFQVRGVHSEPADELSREAHAWNAHMVPLPTAHRPIPSGKIATYVHN